MSFDSIEQAVRSKLHESDKELADSHYLDAAIYQTLKELPSGCANEELAARAAQLAKKLRDEDQSVELKHTPTDRIYGDALVRALAPTIEGLRNNLRERESDKPGPPFPSMEDAAAWIKTRSMKDLGRWRMQSEQRNQAHAEIQRLADTHGIEITFESTLLPYQGPDDEHVKWAPAIPGTYLHRLAKETERIARRTGLPQDALVVHVLAGLKPIRSRARVTTRESHYTLPSGEQIHVNEANVAFRARDLTFEELGGIYRMVKNHVGGKGVEALDDKDEYLWTLVQDMGGPPQAHGTKGPFWRAAQEKINLKYPDEPYTTGNGVKKRYYSILERLQPPKRT